jgi:glycerophosphoryl diester phosphodiesterase
MQKTLNFTYAALCGIFFSSTLNAQQMVDVQGHRGSRGLMPENTIPAFIRALEIGVTTLEMDASITRDGKVVVSHEPFLSHIICYDAAGNEISEEQEKSYNIYQMTYEELSRCDCGSKPHPSFPEQEKMKVSKPLLSDVINAVEAYIAEKQLKPVNYNIETKSSEEGDNIFHPAPDEFVDLLMAVIKEGNIAGKTTIQSFDVRTLQYAHKTYPEMELALLVGNSLSPKKNLQLLGFTPEIYSPHYRLVSEKTVAFARKNGMKIIPWTVNEPEDIRKVLALKIDGIISDYPDRVMQVLQE